VAAPQRRKLLVLVAAVVGLANDGGRPYAPGSQHLSEMGYMKLEEILGFP
jgi:hypothetical protein